MNYSLHEEPMVYLFEARPKGLPPARGGVPIPRIIRRRSAPPSRSNEKWRRRADEVFQQGLASIGRSIASLVSPNVSQDSWHRKRSITPCLTRTRSTLMLTPHRSN